MHAPDTPIPADAPESTDIPLTPAQLQAASLLAAGQSPAAVAHSLSIHRATLHRWRQEAHFAAHLQELLTFVAQETAARASQLALQALAHLEKQFHNPATPPDLRTKLAFRILSLYSRPSALKHLARTPMQQNATPCDTPVTQYALRNTPSLPATPCDTPQPHSGTKYQAPITPRNHAQPTPPVTPSSHSPSSLSRSVASSLPSPVTQYALRNTQSPHPCLACAVAAVPLG